MKNIDLGAVTAYALAVKNGFVGTEEEWLASLKGQKGDKGDQGLPGYSDWNAPEGEAGHILNRTHYEETTEGWVELPVEGEWVEADDDVWMYLTNAPLGLIVGETYKVNWDGTDYECVAQDFSTVSGMESAALGNLTGFGLAGNNEPFMMQDIPSQGSAAFSATDFTADHTFSIYHHSPVTTVHPLDHKYLPDGVPYVAAGGTVEVLPEMTPAGESGEFGITTPVSLTIGERYTVTLDGTAYEATAVDGAELSEGNAGWPLLVNDGADLMTGEGLVFALIVYPPEAYEEIGFYAALMLTSGANEVTISITQGSAEIRKLDNRCLDLAWLPTMTDGKGDEIYPETEMSLLNNGGLHTTGFPTVINLDVAKTYIVILDGVEYKCAVQTVDLNGAPSYFLGNLSLVNAGADSGEPFIFGSTPTNSTGATYNTVLVVPDGGDSAFIYKTFGLYTAAKVPNKLPAAFLPDDATEIYLTSPNGTKYAITVSDDGTLSVAAT